MTFQRIIAGLLVLTIGGLAASLYVNWKTYSQLQTMKAFVEGSAFAEAVAACERAQSTTPFKWNGGKMTAIVGLNSVKPGKGTGVVPFWQGASAEASESQKTTRSPTLRRNSFMVPVRGREEGRSRSNWADKPAWAAAARASVPLSTWGRCR